MMLHHQSSRVAATLLFVAVVCLALVAAEPPFYGKGSSVVNLNTNNYESTVYGSEHIWLVEFYAPWCGHCKNLKPEYEKAATNLKGIAKLGAVNCDEESNKELCGRMQIKGFPTLKFFPSQANAKGQKAAEEYQSGRTVKDIVNFMTGRLPSFVEKLTEQSISKFITSNKHAKAILFTDKPKTSNLYKALSVDFHHSLPLGEIRTTNQEVLDKFNVKSMPTLLLFKSDSETESVKYDGKLDHDSISAFLTPFENLEVKQKKQQSGGSKSGDKKQKPKEKEAELEPVLDHAVLIESQEQFDKYCANGLCAVSLFDFQSEDDKESNERYIDMLNKIAKKQAGRVKIVYMDGSIQANFIKDFDLSGLPNTFVININKMAYTPYLGSYTEEAVEEFLGSVLVGKKRAVPFKTVPKVVPKVTVSKEQPKPKANVKDEL